MRGQLVDLKFLPSKGISYPEDIEIYVKPLSIKEQIDMSRYGISTAEYFTTILNGVTINGNFDKNNLLHADVNFMDIVRRLFSFDTSSKITLEDVTCIHPDCQHKFNYEFTIDQIDFTEFNEDIFGKHFKFMEDTEDELEIVVSPLTVSEFISMSKRIKNYTDRKNEMSSIFLEYICTCTRDVVDRKYESIKERNAFLKSYLSELYMAKDKKTLKAIEDETVIQVKPFKVLCDQCGRETEVLVTPTSNFQQ